VNRCTRVRLPRSSYVDAFTTSQDQRVKRPHSEEVAISLYPTPLPSVPRYVWLTPLFLQLWGTALAWLHRHLITLIYQNKIMLLSGHGLHGARFMHIPEPGISCFTAKIWLSNIYLTVTSPSPDIGHFIGIFQKLEAVDFPTFAAPSQIRFDLSRLLPAAETYCVPESPST
jgi:hypothetical protein